MAAKRSTIVLIGGVPGMGKTSICADLAKEFGIGIVLNGDYLREFARSLLASDPEASRILKTSVYEAWKLFGDRTENNAVKGYVMQGAILNNGVNALIERAKKNGESIIIETLYFIPNQIKAIDDAGVIKLYLYSSDPELHKRRLLERTRFSHANSPGDRLVKEIDMYRAMMNYSLSESKKHKINVFDNLDYNKTHDEVLQFVRNEVSRQEVQAAEWRINMAKIRAKASAHPTMGFILLGGITDKVNRLPLYTTAGIAYTGLDHDIFAETILYAYSGKEKVGVLDGKFVDTKSGNRSPFEVIDRHSKRILDKFGLNQQEYAFSFDSRNHGILSGSSDAGAAAIGKCIAGLCGNDMDWIKFENELRIISESVGRSLYGGLTITPVREGVAPHTERLLDENAFRDYVILAATFKSAQRVSADAIHEGIVKHPDYGGRIKSAEEKGLRLRDLVKARDIEGIFNLAENDTHEWHGLLQEVGLDVMTSEMRAYMNRLRELRSSFWNRYLVVSGSNVFTFVRRKDVGKTVEEVSKHDAVPTLLKVAGGAKSIVK